MWKLETFTEIMLLLEVFFLLDEGNLDPFYVLLAVVLIELDAYLRDYEKGFFEPTLFVLSVDAATDGLTV